MQRLQEVKRQLHRAALVRAAVAARASATARQCVAACAAAPVQALQLRAVDAECGGGDGGYERLRSDVRESGVRKRRDATQRAWNLWLRATKSVSELISTSTAARPALATPIRPSAARRDACQSRKVSSACLRAPATRATHLFGGGAVALCAQLLQRRLCAGSGV